MKSLERDALTSSDILYALSVNINEKIRINPAVPRHPHRPILSTMELTHKPAKALVILVNPLIGENHFALSSGVEIELMNDQY